MFYLLSWMVVTSLGTLYPIYLSYKAIKVNDVQALETLLMYWVVMGTVSAVEGTVEWMVNWIPFYYHLKTIILLWLTLPQIQGSTYVYVTYIHPFLLDHEHDIDAALVEAKEKAKRAGLEYLRVAVEKMKEIVVGTIAPSMLAQNVAPEAEQQPPPMDNPSNFAVHLLRQYGPAAYAAGNALLHPMNTRSAQINANAVTADKVASFVDREQARRRRADYERELGSLPSTPNVVPQSMAGASGLDSHLQPGSRSPSTLSAASSSARELSPSNASTSNRRVSSPLPVPGTSGKDPVASRIDRSFYGGGMAGFENIDRDEVAGVSYDDWGKGGGRRGVSDTHASGSGSAVPHVGMVGVGAEGEGREEGGGWWFGWGGKPLDDIVKDKEE